MNARQRLAVLAGVFLAAGLLGWIWQGDWRWCVTGAILALVCAIIGENLPKG